MVYGVDALFPIQLASPVIKFLQEIKEEPDDIRRRMFQIIQLQQERGTIENTTEMHRERMKESFDKKVKKDVFAVGDLVLRWDA